MLDLSRPEARLQDHDSKQLRDALVTRTLAQLSRGQTTEEHKSYLRQYMTKWSLGGKRMNLEQFASVLASLKIPYQHAAEAFAAADSSGSGHAGIADLCNAVFGSSGEDMSSSNRPPRPFSAQGRVQRGRNSVDSLERTPCRPLTAGCRGLAVPPAPYYCVNEDAWDEYLQPFSVSVGLPTMKLSAHGHKATRPSSAHRAKTHVGHSQKRAGTPVSTLHLKSTNEDPEDLDLSNIVVEKFRKVIIDRGGAHGIHALGRVFKILDDDGNRNVSLDELEDGLKQFGLHLKEQDFRVLLASTDRDGSGSLSLAEFINIIRGPISKRRKEMIDIAFNKLDTNGDGYITVHDLKEEFSPRHHASVLEGDVSARSGLEHFLSMFDVDPTEGSDGKISRKEFTDYYKNLSASIDSDEHFELMLRNAWHISGGSGQTANTANTRLLVKLTDGTEKVVALEDDLGLNLKDFKAVKAQLKRQGIVNVASFSKASRM